MQAKVWPHPKIAPPRLLQIHCSRKKIEVGVLNFGGKKPWCWLQELLFFAGPWTENWPKRLLPKKEKHQNLVPKAELLTVVVAEVRLQVEVGSNFESSNWLAAKVV